MGRNRGYLVSPFALKKYFGGVSFVNVIRNTNYSIDNTL